MDNKKVVLIAAGGTGGHVFPGLALATELKKRHYSVHWLGTEAGIESRLVADQAIPLHLIAVKGIRGKGRLALLSAPLNIVWSVLQARKVVKKLQPALVVGLGGFVAGPGGAAARLSGIPLLIHEQNAIAGTTNKILAKFSRVVLTAFPSAFARGVCIGNPVREAFFQQKSSVDKDGCLRILVVGGSRGARAINAVLPKALAMLADRKSEVKVWHQCGDALLIETRQYYKDCGVELFAQEMLELVPGACAVSPFIDDMAAAYTWADLVICRSGALTVSELAAVGVAALLIPFPYAIDDHQTRNAEYLEQAGGAIVWQQKALSAERLCKKICEMIDDRHQVVNMGIRAKQCATPDTVRQFADWCDTLISSKATVA